MSSIGLKIVITDASVDSRQVQGKRGAFESREQFGWIDLPSGERRRVRISLPRGHEPYKVGQYTIAPSSFVVGTYGDLEFSRQLELVPVVASAAAGAAAAARG